MATLDELTDMFDPEKAPESELAKPLPTPPRRRKPSSIPGEWLADEDDDDALPVTCEECGGSGEDFGSGYGPGGDACEHCDGKGTVSVSLGRSIEGGLRESARKLDAEADDIKRRRAKAKEDLSGVKTTRWEPPPREPDHTPFMREATMKACPKCGCPRFSAMHQQPPGERILKRITNWQCTKCKWETPRVRR